MKLHISEKAAAWYKNEMALNEGAYVRFFVRYGGFSTIQPGFSLGISNELPEEVGVEAVIDSIHFYIEKKDLWYFDNHDFFVELDAKLEEPAFTIAN